MIRDVVQAVVLALIGKRRVAYTSRVDVRAPRDVVWRLIDGDDVTFEAAGLNVRLEPIAEIAEGYVGHMSVHGKPVTTMAFQKLKVEPLEFQISRYLPEHSAVPSQFGEDDIITVRLADGPGGTTRLGFMREMTHTSFATRIVAPMGVRQGAWLVEKQAEADAGIAPPQRGAAWQLGMAAVAFLSFALIVGWEDALVLMAVVAVHEGGHAVAMLRYRLGVAFVGFIPFLGGMAAPARAYDSDWQHGVVALMGVGISLPVALALYRLGDVTGSVVVANAAALFAFVNGANLLPLPGLDGGIVLRLLSHRIHPALAHVVMWAMMVAFVALAVWLASAWVWIAVAFGLLQLVLLSSFHSPPTRQVLGWGGAAMLLVLYLGLFAVYIALALAALRQVQALA